MKSCTKENGRRVHLDLVPGLGDKRAAGRVYRVEVSRARSARRLHLLPQRGVQPPRLRAGFRALGRLPAKRRHLNLFICN